MQDNDHEYPKPATEAAASQAVRDLDGTSIFQLDTNSASFAVEAIIAGPLEHIFLLLITLRTDRKSVVV